MSLGDKLKRQRQSRGIHLAAIAEATKIPSRYLEALESDDLASLPGTAFNKGYVRAYAEQVGLDPDEAVEAYRQEELAQGQMEPSAEEVTREISRLVDEAAAARPDASRQRLAAGWIMGGILVVGLAAGAGWYFLRGAAGGSASPAGAAPPPTTNLAGGSPRPAIAPPATEDGEPAAAAEDAGEPTRIERAAPASGSPPAAAAPPPATPEVPAAQNPSPPGPEPATPPSATPERASAPTTSMSIPDSGVGTDVVDHDLVGAGDRFPAGSRVCFWTRVIGGTAGDTIRHTWMHEGTAVHTTVLEIGGPHWRTYTCKTLRSPGAWSVEARNAAGMVLAQREFTALP